MVGEKITVKATIPQKIDPQLIRFIWDGNGNFKNGAAAADGLSYSFLPVDTTPVTVSLKALAQEGELAELDNESVTIIAKTYQVSVSQPKRIGLPPRIWVPGKGIIDVPQAIAVFQNAEVHCTLSPKPDGRLRYNWKLNPDGCSVSTPYSSSTSLNAHKKGRYQILVTVTVLI